MVIVRESPHAKLSPSKNTTQWPPKSPFQALLSSPSGRKKWQDRRLTDRERSLSPSPIKKSSKALQALSAPSDGENEQEDEDEETLHLQLREIQAKLKLKKLRKEREGAEERATSPRKARPREETLVEVPLSPVRNREPPKEQTSPARRRLGLSAELKADGVSLKRARDGTQIKQARSRGDGDVFGNMAPKPSFSERLAKSKEEALARVDRLERIERGRREGFGVMGREAGCGGGTTPRGMGEATRPQSARRAATSEKLDRGQGVGRSASTRTSQPQRPHASQSKGLFTSTPSTQPNTTNQQPDSDSDSSLNIENDAKAATPLYDPYSGTHLSKRHLSHSSIARALTANTDTTTEIYTIPRLFKEIAAPHYDPPDIEGDYVVFGILASKSTPHDTKATHKTSDSDARKGLQEDEEKPKNKFMVLHLTDLKWELDCFLFGTAFDTFWKLTPGTLLAILNPGIYPPPKSKESSGRFSLKLGSSEDSIMEVGIARDLGYCSSVRKDGKVCGQWIDKRKTDICQFHLELMVDRERKGRMEVNTMWRSEGNRDTANSASNGRGRQPNNKNKANSRGTTFSREHGHLYSVPGTGGSAASLLDAEDTDALHGMTRAEASRKRIASAQRERDLAKKLGQMGKGVGAEYLRAQTQTAGTGTGRMDGEVDGRKRDFFDKPRVEDLGLLGKKAEEQRLSPIKDGRKRHFGSAAVGAAGIGWGGARKAGLLQPKENAAGRRLASPEKGQSKLNMGVVGGRSGSQSPSKKRARFQLEKGVREPGRDSLPAAADVEAGAEDEDDGLEIV